MISTDDFLRLFPQFRQGSHETARQMLSSSRQQAIPQGSRIYAEGEACQGIAFVLSGEIRVFKIGETGREITLYEIGPGETCILNASCILSGTTYPANASAGSDVDVLLVPSSTFRKLVVDSEDMRSFVFALLSRRLATVMELIEEVAFGRVDQRLRDYLVQKSVADVLQATHQKIANDLGTSREVVSRLLKDLERKNKVKLTRNSITLLDV